MLRHMQDVGKSLVLIHNLDFTEAFRSANEIK